MTRGVAHPVDLRAEVVAAVMAGTTIAQAARQFGLSKQTVSQWANESDLRTVRTEKGDDQRDHLRVLILQYFDTGVRALIAQAEVMSDPDYCRLQPAAGLAIAHGVLADKLTSLAATAETLGLIGPEAQGPIVEQLALEPPAAPSGTT